jgi:hypothetical protein
LGIDNEELYNEGGITPAKHAATIAALRRLSTQAPTFSIPKLIGAEDFNPAPGWVADLNAAGWGDTADLFGTHYYKFRPRSSLAAMAAQTAPKDLWNSEVHWDNLNPRDELNEAEAALATFFDCTDLGLNGFSWWSYRRLGFRGEMRRALTTSTHHAHPVATVDADGVDVVNGTLITRAYLRGDILFLWAVNNHPALDQPLQGIRPDHGGISGPASFTRWTDLGIHEGVLPVSPAGTIDLAMPRRSITLLSIPVTPAPCAFRILSIDWEPGRPAGLVVQCPELGRPYHVQVSENLTTFMPIPGSTFTPGQHPFPLQVHDPGAAAGSYLRIAEGPAPAP